MMGRRVYPANPLRLKGLMAFRVYPNIVKENERN